MSIYLSASSISDFIKCPQKVLYRRTKAFPEKKSKEMIIGNIAHSAVQKGWKNRDEAYSIVREEGKAEGLAKSDITHLEFLMDIFFLNFAHRLTDKDRIEYSFKIPLYDDVFIVGRMDRISNGNVYDWKTGSRISEKLWNDVQCIVYNYAYNRIFSEAPASICVASLATGELIPYSEDNKYTNELFDKIIPRMIKTIKTESYDKLGMFNHSCFRCPYKLGCLGGAENYVMDNRISPE